MKSITSAHSMDTVFYAVDENGYLYECWSDETGAVPESYGADEVDGKLGHIGSMEINTEQSVSVLLNSEIDVYGNFYRYDIVTPSKAKVNDTPLRRYSLPFFKGNSFIINPENAKIYSTNLSTSLITRLVKELTNGEAERIRKFKRIFDKILKEYQLINNSGEFALFWGFKDIVPASLLLALPELFKEEITWANISTISLEDRFLRPVITRIKSIESPFPDTLNNVFKKAVKVFLKEDSK